MFKLKVKVYIPEKAGSGGRKSAMSVFGRRTFQAEEREQNANANSYLEYSRYSDTASERIEGEERVEVVKLLKEFYW